MWWATLTFTCSFAVYPVRKHYGRPECFVETSTSYEQIIVDQREYHAGDPVKEFIAELKSDPKSEEK